MSCAAIVAQAIGMSLRPVFVLLLSHASYLSMTVLLFGASHVLAQAPVATETTAAHRSGAYVRISLGVGVETEQYLTYSRDALGGVLAVTGTFGARIGGGFVLGGTIGFEPLLGVTGHGPAGSFASAIAPFAFIGPTLAYEGDVVRFELTIGVGGGGTPDTGPPAYGAGGVGLVITPTLAFAIVDFGSGTLDLGLRPILGFLSDNDEGDLLMLAGGTAQVALLF